MLRHPDGEASLSNRSSRRCLAHERRGGRQALLRISPLRSPETVPSGTRKLIDMCDERPALNSSNRHMSPNAVATAEWRSAKVTKQAQTHNTTKHPMLPGGHLLSEAVSLLLPERTCGPALAVLWSASTFRLPIGFTCGNSSTQVESEPLCGNSSTQSGFQSSRLACAGAAAMVGKNLSISSSE